VKAAAMEPLTSNVASEGKAVADEANK
jgi:hypothetical protein